MNGFLNSDWLMPAKRQLGQTAWLLGTCLILLLNGSVCAQKKYAILVGVNKYQLKDKLPELKYAEKDVIDLGAQLSRTGYVTILLTSKDKATQANITQVIDEVLEKAQQDDTVLIAFAGHGVQFEGSAEAYFCPVDGRPFPDRTDTLVSLNQIYQKMERCFAGSKIMLVDACRDDPGAARRTRGIDADSSPPPPKGVAVLFSCSSGQRAYESPEYQHGVFFHYILEGLKGQAEDKEGDITFETLSNFVRKKVGPEVKRLFGTEARQSPNHRAGDMEGLPFLLASNAARVQPLKPIVNKSTGKARTGNAMGTGNATGKSTKGLSKNSFEPIEDPRRTATGNETEADKKLIARKLLYNAAIAHNIPRDDSFMRHRSVQLVKSYDTNNKVNEYRQTETVDGLQLTFSVKDEAVSNGTATQLRLEEFVGGNHKLTQLGQPIVQSTVGDNVTTRERVLTRFYNLRIANLWSFIRDKDPSTNLTWVDGAKVKQPELIGVQIEENGMPVVQLYMNMSDYIITRLDIHMHENGQKVVYTETLTDHKMMDGVLMAGKSKLYKPMFNTTGNLRLIEERDLLSFRMTRK